MWNANSLKQALASLNVPLGVDHLLDSSVAVTFPALVIALHRMGSDVSQKVLTEALMRLVAAGVVDAQAKTAEGTSILFLPFHLAMALFGNATEKSAAADEIRRTLEDFDTPAFVWAGLLHILDGSGLSSLGDALERRNHAKRANSEGCCLANEAVTAALEAAGSDVLLPLKTPHEPIRTAQIAGTEFREKVKTARKFAQPVAQTKKSAKPVKNAVKRSAEKTSKFSGKDRKSVV